MPEVATTRPSSHRPSDRSSSACTGTASTNDDGGCSANASNRARLKAGHSSSVAGRSCPARSVIPAVYPAPSRGSRRACEACGGRGPLSAAQVGQRRHHPAVLVLVLGEVELGEDPLGVLLDGA